MAISAAKKREKIQAQIAELKEKLETLTASEFPLSKRSPGMPELIAAFNSVLEQNGVETLELFEYLLKAKRTGMKLSKKSET